MERYRRVAWTSIAAIAARGVGVLTALISVPLTLHYLGSERYGLWMTISSTIAMVGFADLGVGNGLLNAIAAANGKEDEELARKNVSSGFFLLSGIAALIILGFAIFYQFVPWARVFNVTSRLAEYEAGPSTAIVVVCFALSMPLSIVQRIQLGYQEGFKNYLWTALGGLLGLAGVLIGISLRLGLPWLVLAMAGGPVLGLLSNWVHVFGVSYRELRPRFRSFNLQISKTLARTGFIFFILTLLSLLGIASDNLIIAQVLGASAVAGYAVVQKLFSVCLLAQYFLVPLWPAFGEAMARDDRAWARRALDRSLILSLLFGLLIAAPLTLFGKRIVSLWAGPTIAPSTLLLCGFALFALIGSYVGAMSTYLNSGQLVSRQLPFFALASLSALALKYLGALHWRTEGVIWASVVGFGLFYVTPAARLAYRSLQTDHLSAAARQEPR